MLVFQIRSRDGSTLSDGGGTSGFSAPVPVFGQPAAIQNQPANAFGQQQSVFGQPTMHPQSAFGQVQSQAPSVFSALSAQPSAFTPLSNPANPLNGGTAFNPLESFGMLTIWSEIHFGVS